MADYKIQRGDTLSRIAKQNNTTVSELARLNGIKDPKIIRAGATLKLPGAQTALSIPDTGGQAVSMSSANTTQTTAAESGGTAEQPDWKTIIDEIYSKSKESQLAALEGQYQQQKSEYDKQISEAPEKYYPLRNEAYINNTMAERSRKESMANMGLSGAGGASQTLQQRNTGNFLSTLGDISRQQQDYTNNVNFALGQLTKQYDSSKSSIESQIESEKNKAYLDQGNWEDNFGLQSDQFGLTKNESEFNRYLQLYNSKLITKAQLKEKFPDLFS